MSSKPQGPEIWTFEKKDRDLYNLFTTFETKTALIRQKKVIQMALLSCLNVLYLSLVKEWRMKDLKIQ